MSEVMRILANIDQGDPRAAEELLPLVYDELRHLAAQKMAHEASDHTLQPTALVHEAYLRLVSVDNPQSFNGRGHFFCAVAEAMRRILIENARRKGRAKRGGEQNRVPLDQADFVSTAEPEHLMSLDEVLDRFGATDDVSAKLVKLRFFAGMSIEEAGEMLGISRAAAYRRWLYARAWLHCALCEAEERDPQT